MAIRIKLRGTRFNNPALPTLEDYGYLPPENLLAAYDFEGASSYLVDKSGNGYDLSTVSGDVAWADGLFTFGGAAAYIEGSAPLADEHNFTAVAVFRPSTTSLEYLIKADSNRGVGLQKQQNKAAVQYADTLNNNVAFTGSSAPAKAQTGEFIMFAVGADGTNIYTSCDGAAWDAGTAIDADGVRVFASSYLRLGNNSTNAPEGDLAAAAYWEGRCLSDAELATVYKAMQRLMVRKGHSV